MEATSDRLTEELSVEPQQIALGSQGSCIEKYLSRQSWMKDSVCLHSESAPNKGHWPAGWTLPVSHVSSLLMLYKQALGVCSLEISEELTSRSLWFRAVCESKTGVSHRLTDYPSLSAMVLLGRHWLLAVLFCLLGTSQELSSTFNFCGQSQLST